MTTWTESRAGRRPARRSGPLARLAVVAACASLCAASTSAADYPPSPGTDRESDGYLEAAEAFLRSLDLDDESLVFERLGGTTATNWSVAKDGVVVADLKCTSGNTNHHGAVVAYRLGRELGFDIYPVAVYRDVHRVIDGRRIDEQCALKEWATAYTQYYWTRETFTDTDSRAKRRLAAGLRCDSPKPDRDEPFVFEARSAYGQPKTEGVSRVHYLGNTTLFDAAMDFSNMMVIDALIGNEDRFPGGNTFFRSVTTNAREIDGGFQFEKVRLFSLDNEAAFKGRTPASTHSARDLKASVSRFDAAMIDGLRRLAGDAAALDRITGGHDELSAFIRDGIGLVLDRYSEAVAACGGDQAGF